MFTPGTVLIAFFAVLFGVLFFFDAEKRRPARKKRKRPESILAYHLRREML